MSRRCSVLFPPPPRVIYSNTDLEYYLSAAGNIYVDKNMVSSAIYIFFSSRTRL